MAIALTKASMIFPNVAITEATIAVWHELFEFEDAPAFSRAFVATLKAPGRTFFPTPGEVQAELEKNTGGEISLTPQEAVLKFTLDTPLIADARRFADWSVPAVTGTYESPEELDRANRIQAAMWEREFRGRFERKQAEVKRGLRSGMKLPDAYRKALPELGELPTEIKKLIEAI